MIERRKVLTSGLLGAAAVGLWGPRSLLAAPPGYGINGQRAPELEVSHWIDRHGNPGSFRLADHAGKWVFLKCFQSWCPGCHSHGFPALKQLSDHFDGHDGIVFAGIQTVFEGHTTNTIDKVRQIQLQYELAVDMGHDPGIEQQRPQTMIDYRTGGTPWWIVIDPGRRVVFNDYGIDVERTRAFFESELT